MIARIWKGPTKNEKADAYAEILRRTGVKDLALTEGNQGVLVLRRKQGERTEHTVMSFWDSMESITRFAGPDPQKAVYYPEDREYLLEFTPEVEHHDVVITTLDLESTTK